MGYLGDLRVDPYSSRCQRTRCGYVLRLQPNLLAGNDPGIGVKSPTAVNPIRFIQLLLVKNVRCVKWKIVGKLSLIGVSRRMKFLAED